MPDTKTPGALLGHFKNVGGAPVVVTLTGRGSVPGEGDAAGWGSVTWVDVEARCTGHGCTDRATFTHGASMCNCCGSNPDVEHALARAEREGCAWARPHAERCRAMPVPEDN